MARFLSARRRKAESRKPGLTSRVVTWVLLVIWAIALFRPGGPAVPLIQESASKLRAWYLFEFGWERIARGSSVVAGTSGAVGLVAFSDYECPFCQQAEVVVDSFTARHPETAVGFRHVTRSGNPRSTEIAIAAVCAAELRVLTSIHDSLYLYASRPPTQRSGLDGLQTIAGEETRARWTQCVEDPTSAVLSRLSVDSALVTNLRLRQTPTFIGPHGRVVGVPTLDALTDIAGLRSPDYALLAEPDIQSR